MSNEEKVALRKRLRGLRPDGGTRRQESALICRLLQNWPVYREAACLAAYIPMAHEADVRTLLRQALAEGKRLLLPRITGGEMRFYQVTEMENLRPGAFGIPEPDENALAASLREAELILTPLEAVDPMGRRLGKGGGFYDRALCGIEGFAMGVALNYQVVDRVPASDWDVSLYGWADPGGIHILTKAR